MPLSLPDVRSDEGSNADANEATAVFVAAFFAELLRSGVQHVCICPGSRSTPLTLAACRTAGLQCSSHHDERSAGFFALGLARAAARPVALIATSGTAVANFLPAVVEAHYARVPLLLLTADRPPELRGWGAGQTIDQLHIFGRYVRRFDEVHCAQDSPALLRYARSLACRAVADSLGRPPGPVHLNWPLREPFALQRPAGAAGGDAVEPAAWPQPPQVGCGQGELRATEAQLQALADLVAQHERGVIVCGPLAPDAAASAAIAALSERAGWPLIADPTSQLRCGPHIRHAPVVAHADILLRHEHFAASHAPEVVVALGGAPVSKALRRWLDASRSAHWLLIDPDDHWSDPDHRATLRLQVDAGALCRDLSARLPAARDSAWCRDFTRADAAVAALLSARLGEGGSLYETAAAFELSRCLPAGATLYVSNSMPVRDLDAFMPARSDELRVLCNRGANGIDGVLSSALGAAVAGAGPVVLLIGDIALLHDIGALLTARRHRIDLTIVLLNNDGGAIFSYLPIADGGEREAFDDYFRLPHGLSFAAAADFYGLDYERIGSAEALRRALQRCSADGGTHLLELPIDPAGNLRHFRELIAEAAELGAAQAGAT